MEFKMNNHSTYAGDLRHLQKILSAIAILGGQDVAIEARGLWQDVDSGELICTNESSFNIIAFDSRVATLERSDNKKIQAEPSIYNKKVAEIYFTL